MALAVGRALQDHQRRLARSAGPEAALFAALPLDGVEAKLESVKQQAGGRVAPAGGGLAGVPGGLQGAVLGCGAVQARCLP